MTSMIVMQDWLTMRGTGAASPDHRTFLPHRDHWLCVADAIGAVLLIQIRSFDHLGTDSPLLRIETAISDEGPWETVESWNSTQAGEHWLYLRREPGAPTNQRMARYLRWAVVEQPAGSGAWHVCFRVTALLEYLNAWGFLMRQKT